MTLYDYIVSRNSILNDTIDKVDRDTRVNVCPDVEFVDKFMFNKKFDYTLYPDW